MLFRQSDIAPLKSMVIFSDGKNVRKRHLIIIIMVRVVDVTLNIMLTEKMSEWLHVINWERVLYRQRLSSREKMQWKLKKVAQKTIACQWGINMNKMNACITESTVVIRLKLSLHENYSKYWIYEYLLNIRQFMWMKVKLTNTHIINQILLIAKKHAIFDNT